jgi:LuxR family maltose regulon positive regulatory protein
LIDRLDHGLSQPLTLLASPPGYGKTTLLCDWARRCPIPVAWLCIDEHGDDLRSFVAHVVAAIQTVAPSIGRDTLGLLNLTDLPSPRSVAATLDNELVELTDDLVLVLDDFHLIDDSSVHEFVNALLEHPPPGFHLVLATRSDPPLPLARLRMHGHLTELRAVDLRFTTDETAAFFEQSSQLSVDAATAAMIEQRADGWAAGLRMAALSLRDGAAPATVLAAFEGRRLRGLIEYLVDEVLTAQPEDVRQLLLSTSIVERITAPLAVALLDVSTSEETVGAILDRITQAGLFVSLMEEDPRWYRVHAVFRDALRERLTRVIGARGVAALHRRASAWFEDHGLIDEAIYHAKVGGDDEGAALIVERQIHPALDRDDAPMLESWLRLLAPGSLERRPALVLGQLWIAYLRGRWMLHGRLLAEAEASLDAHAPSLDAATVGELRGEIALARSMRLLEEGDIVGAESAAQRALTLLPSSHRYLVSLAGSQLAYIDLINGRGDTAIQRLHALLGSYDGPVDLMFARTLASLMRLEAFLGNLQESQQAAADLLRLASEQGFWSHVSWANYQLGAIAYELNDLDAAVEHFTAVVADPHNAHTTPLREGTFGLALTQRARGFEAQAQQALDRLQAFLQETANLEQLTQVRAFQSHLSSVQDGVMEAPLRARGNAPRRISTAAMTGNLDVLRIQSLIHVASTETLDESESLIEELLGGVRAFHFIAGEIELLALRSVLAQTRGQHERAADTLAGALDLAAERGFVRTFLDRGPVLAAVLRTCRPRSRHGAYIDRLLAAFAAEASAPVDHTTLPTPPSVSPVQAMDALTEREIEILEKLSARLSYKEIAESLVISPFTVKAHASNIYGKLGASGRRDAIVTARSLGLIAAD